MTAEQKLAMWIVYDHPVDAPEHYVARKWLIEKGGYVPTNTAFKHTSLHVIRIMLSRQGLVPLPRAQQDDPKIVESWI